ncbi:hypothetical protein [Microtetraspora malaysiensis]|uniref:hypothetical protein n=1 Tax=Microtetraspora malaysiensis TaxID=161358 RepID=UPI003D8D02C1
MPDLLMARRGATLLDMEGASVRRVLAVKPEGPWLVIASGAWAVESRHADTDTPFEISRIGLLPLLERPREEVESQAREMLRPGDPDFAEPLRAVVQCGLMARSDYWVTRTLAWIISEEVELFAELLREIALGRGSQASQHAAKRLLKKNGLWSTNHRSPS